MKPKSSRSSPGRDALTRLITGSIAALFLAGCGDSVTAPSVPDVPLLSAAETAPSTLHAGEAARTYFCSTSRREASTQTGDKAGYHYGLIRLRYTEREYATEANGKETRFVVYVMDGAGEVEWAAWCHVPLSPGSVQRALARLGLQGHVPGPDMSQSYRRGDQEDDDGDFSTSSTEVQEPANTEQCQELWGENSFWDPDTGSCIIVLDPIGSGGSGSEPPPPDDDDDYDWGPGPDPGDPDSGGGTDGGDGTPLEPPSPEDDTGCHHYQVWSAPSPLWGPWTKLDEAWLRRGYTITANPVADVALFGEVSYHNTSGIKVTEPFTTSINIVTEDKALSIVEARFQSIVTGSSVSVSICW